MLKIAKVLGIAAILLSLAAGAVSASQESVPDSPLYGIKLQFENWQLASSEGPEAKIQTAMTMAQERVTEAVKLAEGGQEIPESLAERYQERLTTALQSCGELTGEPQQTRLQAGVVDELAVQMQTMTQLMTKLQTGDCEEDCATGPLQTMMQAGTLAQNRLSAPDDIEPGPKGPPDEPGAEKPEAPVMNMAGPQGPARSGYAFEDPDFAPAGPYGPMRNPDAEAGPYGPAEPVGPFDPAVGPGEPQGAQLQDGSNNQGPEQNQNQEPVDGDPYDNSGGDNGDPNTNSGGDADNGGGDNDNSGGNGGGNGGGH